MNIMDLLNPDPDQESSKSIHLEEDRHDRQREIQQQYGLRHDDQERNFKFHLQDAERIIDLLSCSLCIYMFNDPITFSCGNTFCRGCLQQRVTYTYTPSVSITARFVCPDIQCKQRHILTDAQTDVTIKNLVNLCRKELSFFIPLVYQKKQQKLSSDRKNTHREGNYLQQSRSTLNAFESDEDDDPAFDMLISHFGDDNVEEESEEDLALTCPYINHGSLPIISSTSTSTNVTFTTIDRNRLENAILQEFDCKICYSLFIDPITTPCGHTYCKPCLARSLDHNDRCPICRHQIRASCAYFHQHPTNKTIIHFLKSLYPGPYAERCLAVEHELYDSMEVTPIFVCSLVFPKMPCFLQVFEPRYRLMLRRCLESRQRQLGMVLPGRNREQGYCEYGTMLEIRSTEILADGRALVETVGSYRFRVLERGQKDGYDVGKIERIEDIDPEREELLERQALVAAARVNLPNNEPTIAELIAIAREFIDDLRNGGAPWLLQRLNSTYGEMPDDPSDFSFWVASVIPINEYEKYRLLELRSVRERLKLITTWITQLKEQWWFARGCLIS